MISEKLYQAACLVLVVILVVSCSLLGYFWWSAAHDRDKANKDLVTEKGITKELGQKIGYQNDAITRLNTEGAEAKLRYEAALAKSTPVTRRINELSTKIDGLNLKAPPNATCGDAIHILNQAVEGLR